MQGSTHIIGGTAAALAYTALVNDAPGPDILAVAAIFGAAGGLVPDIDHPRSKISRKLPVVNSIVSFFCSHRGFFHTPILYFALWWLSSSFLPASVSSIMVFLWIGALSHLSLDALNRTGVPILFPLLTKRFSVCAVRLGGRAEHFLRFALTVLSGALIVLSVHI